jgi:hypothetical protein
LIAGGVDAARTAGLVTGATSTADITYAICGTTEVEPFQNSG